MNHFIVLLEGNKEVYSEQVEEKGEGLQNSKTGTESKTLERYWEVEEKWKCMCQAGLTEFLLVNERY